LVSLAVAIGQWEGDLEWMRTNYDEGRVLLPLARHHAVDQGPGKKRALPDRLFSSSRRLALPPWSKYRV